MGKRILFSPIGGTDPIRYKRDGSMLHICRHYQPDVVYLYLSHEMMEFHREDNRYVKAIQFLGELLGHSFEINLIERDDLIDVQKYDWFYQDFREEIRKIEQEMEEEDELLVNMASGTPAMKSALLVMATLAEYRFKPIQVSSPQGKMNSEQENREEYNQEDYFRLNQDNAEDAENRCSEEVCMNLMKMIKTDTIKKHIDAYNYPAALSVASELQRDISKRAYRLLQAADARVKLDDRKVRQFINGIEEDFYPVKEEKQRKIFEYALVLFLKVKRQEYADFVRGITPLVVDLLEEILWKECNIRLEECCIIKQKENMLYWSKEKLQQKNLLEPLNQAYKAQGGFREGPVYSNAIAKLLSARGQNRMVCTKVEEMVEIEKSIRNIAAHEVVSVTEEWIQKRTGKTVKGILELVRTLVFYAGIKVENRAWESYDEMNQRIKNYLRETSLPL